MDSKRESMDAATAQMLAHLKRLMPPPAPAGGWGLAFLQASAWALSSRAMARHALAESNLILGQKLVRNDAEAGDWTSDPYSWTFDAATDPAGGASTFYLDMWGAALGVPRAAGGLDASYQRQILMEVPRSPTTNIGMAQAIDGALGVTGTKVVDASDFFACYRLNEGHRLNSGIRLSPIQSADSFWCCFAVVTGHIPDGHTEAEIVSLVNRRKIAGTRLVGVFTDGYAPNISVPTWVHAGITFEASVANPETGATYAWSISGGTIISGQGTDTLSIRAGDGGDLKLTAAQTGGHGDGKIGYATVHVVAAISSVITLDAAEAPAGEAGHTASVPDQPGSTFAWTITGGILTAGQGTRSVTFSTGEADSSSGARCVLTCTVMSSIGVQSVGAAAVNILPYPYVYTHTTQTLGAGATEIFDLDLGKRWHIRAIATSAPARVRVYSSAASRAVDANRVIQPEPQGVDGLLAEAVTADGALSIGMREWAWGSTPGNAAYVSVVNLGAAPAAITTTISTQKNEA